MLKTYVSDHDGTSAKITVAGETIEATFLHPFWVVRGDDLAGRPIRSHLPSVPEVCKAPGRWVDAGDVRLGDDLLLRDGRILPVQSICHQPYRDKVYNLHIAEFECYAVGVNCVLVHNQNGGVEGELTPRQQWLQDVKSLRNKILDAESDLEGVERRGRNFGYGPHSTKGTEQYLTQLWQELANLIANEPQ